MDFTLAINAQAIVIGLCFANGLSPVAGSYGWLVEVPVAAEAVKDGKVTVRLEADNGLAVYGAKFGRYPLSPHVGD